MYKKRLNALLMLGAAFLMTSCAANKPREEIIFLQNELKDVEETIKRVEQVSFIEGVLKHYKGNNNLLKANLVRYTQNQKMTLDERINKFREQLVATLKQNSAPEKAINLLFQAVDKYKLQFQKLIDELEQRYGKELSRISKVESFTDQDYKLIAEYSKESLLKELYIMGDVIKEAIANAS